MKQEPAEATRERLNAAPERRRNLRHSCRGGCQNETDREHRNALAVRGYWQAFQRVEESVRKVLGGANPGQVADEDHGA
ncbi:hypothetical protein BMS3Abin12_00229 [bacterium BMS3Abin12]|nr:hypothetical protein BMS3Abin12_00229 [bacterium BMS3Abin12]GBE49680.1 hypothetical protein BMS3Bbin13_00601 [bacterium BMS3Bbin13]